MQARGLLNLVLLAVAAGLAALILLRPGLEDNNTARPVTAIDPREVKTITLQRADADTLYFSKHIDSWRLDGNPALPADDFQVHTVLALLEVMSVRSYAADALDDLGALGLDPPLAIVTFDATQVDVGATDAIENLRYLRIGDLVYLVTDRFQHLSSAGFSNFVRRALLPGDDAITTLQLPGLTLTQTDGVHWELQPPRADISADAIDTLIGAWARATALYVRRFDAAAAGQETLDTIQVTQGDSRPVEFRILAREPDLILARPEWGIQYHLPGETGAELLGLPESAAIGPLDTGLEPVPGMEIPGLPESPAPADTGVEPVL